MATRGGVYSLECGKSFNHKLKINYSNWHFVTMRCEITFSLLMKHRITIALQNSHEP